MNIKKKFLTYAVFAAGALVLILIFIFSQFQTSKDKPTAAPKAKNSKSIVLDKVLNEMIDYPFLLPSGSDYNFLITRNSGLYRYSITNKFISELDSLKPLGIYNIAYSYDGSNAIVQTNYPAGTYKNYLVDFNNNKNNELSSKMRDVVWTKEGKIIYYYFDEDQKINSLNVANPDGSNWQKIADLDLYNISIQLSPDGAKAILNSPPEGYGELYVYLLDLNTKKITQLTNTGYDMNAKWSLDGKKIVYQVLDSQTFKPAIWQINSDGSNARNLSIQAFANKVSWINDNNILVAMDPNLPNDYQLDDTYISNDSFWVYNIETNQYTQLTVEIQLSDTRNLNYDLAKKIFYFTSSGILYQGKL